MAKIFDKSSVEYLRTDLEHDQLFSENTGPLVIADPTDLVEETSFPLKFHTTGNGVVYLVGRATVQQPIIQGTVLFTLPDRLAAATFSTLPVTLFTGTNDYLVLQVNNNTIVAASPFGIVTDVLILNGSLYLTE